MTSTEMKEYSQLLKETGLNEVGKLLQDGMDCRFCASHEKQIKYILVYEAGNKLYRLIEDESHFALFNIRMRNT